MKSQIPRRQVPVREAAWLMGHSPRWVRDKVKAGELEGFVHGPNDITVSVESIVAYEDKTRVSVGS